MLTTEQIKTILAKGSPDDIRSLHKLLNDPYYNFQPRPDSPHEFDQQTAFVHDNNKGLAIALGGSGSGKSCSAAWKVARFLKTTAPPDDLAKFIIVSEMIDKAANLWQEQLKKFFRPDHIQHTEWLNSKSGLPRTVVFVPHKNGNRWQLLFKGASQGVEAFTSYNETAGFWCDEPMSLEIVYEVWARCRKYEFTGTKFWTLTPMQPFPALEEIYNDQESHEGIKFFHLNTTKNTTLKDLTFIDNTPPDLKDTRTFGAFANLSGQVFKEFKYKDHVKKHKEFPDLSKCEHTMSLDFGYEHPTAALFIAYDRLTDTHYAYKEWAKEGMLIQHKVAELKEIRQQLGWKDSYTTIADPEDAQQRSEFAALGLPTSIARKEPVEESIEEVRKHLMQSKTGQPRLFISDQCENLIREMRQYRWQVSPKKSLNPKPTPQKVVKVDDDLVDCLRYYFLSRAKREMKSWEPIKTNQRPSLWK